MPYTHTHKHIYIYIYIYVYIYIYIYMYLFIYSWFTRIPSPRSSAATGPERLPQSRCVYIHTYFICVRNVRYTHTVHTHTHIIYTYIYIYTHAHINKLIYIPPPSRCGSMIILISILMTRTLIKDPFYERCAFRVHPGLAP